MENKNKENENENEGPGLAAMVAKVEQEASEIEYLSYGGEHHLPLIMNLIDQELSEPYSIFTYRYFVYLWPQLTFLVTLEAEVTNKGALALYGRLGFVRAKRLFRYYLNGVDAFRLKLLFPHTDTYQSHSLMKLGLGTHEFVNDQQIQEISTEE